MEKIQKVLVIEDNKISQYVAAEQIRQCGFSVDFAASREEVLTLLQKNPSYMLVLLDLGLPDVSGLELARELREKNLLSAAIPIVALTASTSDAYQQQAMEYGLDGFIYKPLNQSDLTELLQRLKIAENQV